MAQAKRGRRPRLGVAAAPSLRRLLESRVADLSNTSGRRTDIRSPPPSSWSILPARVLAHVDMLGTARSTTIAATRSAPARAATACACSSRSPRARPRAAARRARGRANKPGPEHAVVQEQAGERRRLGPWHALARGASVRNAEPRRGWCDQRKLRVRDEWAVKRHASVTRSVPGGESGTRTLSAGDDRVRGVRPEVATSWYRCREQYHVDRGWTAHRPRPPTTAVGRAHARARGRVRPPRRPAAPIAPEVESLGASSRSRWRSQDHDSRATRTAAQRRGEQYGAGLAGRSGRPGRTGWGTALEAPGRC